MRPLNCLLWLSPQNIVQFESQQREGIDKIEVDGSGRRKAESDDQQKIKQNDYSIKLLVIQPQPECC